MEGGIRGPRARRRQCIGLRSLESPRLIPRVGYVPSQWMVMKLSLGIHISGPRRVRNVNEMLGILCQLCRLDLETK